MSKVPPKTNTLARHTGKLNMAKYVRQKQVRKTAEKASKTDVLSLQKKRIQLDGKRQFLQAQVDMLLSGKCEPEDVSKIMNVSNLVAMQGMIEGLCLITDCVTEVESCKIKQKDGSVKPGKRRFSVGQLTSDVHDMLVDSLEIQDITCQILNDMGVTTNVWQDKHGVCRSPYLKDNLPIQDDPAEKEIEEGQGAVADDDEITGLQDEDLRRASDFLKKEPVMEEVDTGLPNTGNDF